MGKKHKAKEVHLTPNEDLANRMRTRFEKWENSYKDAAPWPVGKKPDEIEVIEAISSTYKGPNDKTDKCNYAITYMLVKLLGASDLQPLLDGMAQS